MKAIWQSKTAWIQVIGIAMILLNQASDVLGPNATPWIASIMGVLTILNRFLTDTPVSLMGKK